MGTLRPLKLSGEEVPCRFEGAVLQPATQQAPALLLLRLIPRQATGSQFLALNQKIDALAKKTLIALIGHPHS
jgi:hypothetical protein